MPTTISGSSSSGWVDTDSKAGPLSSVHVVIVVINEIEAQVSYFTDLPVHGQPNSSFCDPVHALLDDGQHVNWLDVVHQTSEEVGAIFRIDQPRGSCTTPQLHHLLHILLLKLPHQWWKTTTCGSCDSMPKTLCQVECREQLPAVEKVVHENSGPNIWKTQSKPDDTLGSGR